MNTNKPLLILIILLFLSIPLQAKPYRVLYCGVDSDTVPESIRSGIEKEFYTQLANKNKYTVITRFELRNEYSYRDIFHSLESREDLRSWCQLSDTEKVIAGTVSFEDREYVLRYYVYDYKKDKLEYKTQVVFYPAELTDMAIKESVQKLERHLDFNRAKQKEITQTGYYCRALVPGLPQMYNNYTIKGRVFMGSYFLSLALVGWAYMDYDLKKAQYESYRSSPAFPGDTTPEEEMSQRYYEYNVSRKVFFLTLHLSASIYCLHILDMLFDSNTYNIKGDVPVKPKNLPWYRQDTFSISPTIDVKTIDTLQTDLSGGVKINYAF